MERSELERLLDDARLNATLAWVLVVFVGGVVVANVLEGQLLWAGFAGAVLAFALYPAASYRNPSVMLPWEVLLLAVLPLVGRTFATTVITGNLAMYLSVAAVALILAVELHVFTAVRMNASFAVFFVVVTTMAAAGVWAVARWLADGYLDTGFLPGLTPLMWEFVYSTVAGLVAGLVFTYYFRRRAHIEMRLPDIVEEIG